MSCCAVSCRSTLCCVVSCLRSHFVPGAGESVCGRRAGVLQGRMRGRRRRRQALIGPRPRRWHGRRAAPRRRPRTPSAMPSPSASSSLTCCSASPARRWRACAGRRSPERCTTASRAPRRMTWGRGPGRLWMRPQFGGKGSFQGGLDLQFRALRRRRFKLLIWASWANSGAISTDAGRLRPTTLRFRLVLEEFGHFWGD